MTSFKTHNEAALAWRSVAQALDAAGIHLPDAKTFIPENFRLNFDMAMDAQPGLVTTGNSGIPQMFTNFVDPAVIDVLQAPVKAAEIAGEVRKGSWTDDTVTFIVVENTGNVSSYGDYTGNGRSGANTNFPQRQPYLFQTVEEYGELELERAGLAKLNWAGQIQKSSANNLMRFANRSYFLGINGLQNYGLVNDPFLSASLTPATKAAGNGNVWVFNGAPNASANEVYNDCLALFQQIVNQTQGHVDRNSKLVLAAPTSVETAFGFINTFNVKVREALMAEFPNLRIETAVQYQAKSASNPEGNAGGNLVQMFAEELGGDETVYCAFNEKMRAHAVIRDLSSFKQKKTSGSIGAVWRRPMGQSSMLGV
jgi:hypothetical protein